MIATKPLCACGNEARYFPVEYFTNLRLGAECGRGRCGICDLLDNEGKGFRRIDVTTDEGGGASRTERAAVVDYLRRRGVLRMGGGSAATNSYLLDAADAIERGEHRIRK